MPTVHVVEQGECIASLAARYGFFEETLWNHPGNRALKELRGNPNVLFPGDHVVIPDKHAGEERCVTARRHVFRRRGIPCVFRLQIFASEVPRAGERYVLEVDGRRAEGTTDGEGVLTEMILPQAREGRLVIGDDHQEIRLRFGVLDPVAELSGVKKRLANLGFDCGALEGSMGPETRKALLAFQRRFGLPETGEPDADTRQRLAGFHDEIDRYPTDAWSGGG